MSAHLRYKYCLVPMCKNTTRKTPNKMFLAFPKNTKTRELWYNAMKRDPTKYRTISLKSHLHCCEDHFNLEEDVESYMRVKLMGGNLYLKSGVVPHKFACQKRKFKPQPPPLAEPQISEGSINTLGPEIFNSHTLYSTILGCETETANVSTQTRSVGKINKAVQVKIKCHVRSKGTSTVQTDNITKFDDDSSTMRGRYRTQPAGLCAMCCGPLEVRGTSKSKLPTKATKNNSPEQVERVFIKQEHGEDSFYLEGNDNVKLEPAESDETTSEHRLTPNSPILKSPTEFEVQMTNGQGHFRDSEFQNKKKNHIENECDVFGRVIGTLLNEMPVRDALELQLALQKTITDFRLRKH